MEPSGRVMARHSLSSKKGATIIQKEHYEGIKSSTPKTAPRIREIFFDSFASGDKFYQGLVRSVSYNAAYHAKKILEQRSIYEDEFIEEALKKAREFGAFSSQAVKNILAGCPLKEDPLRLTASSYTRVGSIKRSLSEYNLLLKETN